MQYAFYADRSASVCELGIIKKTFDNGYLKQPLNRSDPNTKRIFLLEDDLSKITVDDTGIANKDKADFTNNSQLVAGGRVFALVEKGWKFHVITDDGRICDDHGLPESDPDDGMPSVHMLAAFTQDVYYRCGGLHAGVPSSK